MLIPILVLLTQPSDGIQRFKAFLNRNKAFSVQIAATSNSIPVPGKGTFTLSRPSSFRLSMVWGTADYNYVKSAAGAVEFERYRKTYQDFPTVGGLNYFESAFAPIQMHSIPTPFINGDLIQYLPKGTKYKLTSKKRAVETYTGHWAGDGGEVKVIVGIGADGRLTHFDNYVRTTQGVSHRVMDFSNYALRPHVGKETFNPEPPLGFTAFQLPPVVAEIEVGQTLHLGRWKSAAGVQNIDPLVRGKLIIVREPGSRPADALVAYLKTQSLPVKTVVASLGAKGGQFWSPPANVAGRLSSVGTPLTILVSPTGKIQRMWLGFNADKPDALVTELIAVAKGTSGE